jgi:hypothetical protein
MLGTAAMTFTNGPIRPALATVAQAPVLNNLERNPLRSLNDGEFNLVSLLVRRVSGGNVFLFF